jgi:hypothetical protein
MLVKLEFEHSAVQKKKKKKFGCSYRHFRPGAAPYCERLKGGHPKG